MKRLISIASALTLVTAAAHAQTTQTVTVQTAAAQPGSADTIDEIRKAYRVHAGPFYVNPALQLKELGVDTNVFNQAGDQLSDFTFTLTPKADVAVPFARRALLKTLVAMDAVYYAKYGSERSLDPQVTLRGEIYLHRLTLFAQDAYLNTRQRPNYEIDLRSRHLQNDVGAGVDVRVTPKFSVEVAGQQGKTRYDADAFFQGTSLQETLNRDSTGYSVTARDRVTPLTTVSLRYENIRDRFIYSPVRDADTFRVMPGVEFKPKALINGAAFVGYRKFTPKSDLVPEYTGLVAQLALSYTLLGATTFGITFDRDLTYSYETESPYFVDNSPGIFVRRALGGRWDAIGTVARHTYEYQDIAVQGFTPSQRTDTTDNYGLNVGYRMKRETRVGFGFSYYTRDSTRALFKQYTGLRAGTTVTYGF